MSSRITNDDTRSEPDLELIKWLSTNPIEPFPFLRLPTTIILQILTSLDLPDLDSLRSTGHQTLITLTNDSVLHRQRLRSVATICLEPHLLNRPNRLELIDRKIFRGLNVISKIRRGSYLHSPSSIRTFEASQNFNRAIVKERLNRMFRCRPLLDQLLRQSNLLDQEVRNVSWKLLPTIRVLKREIVKDRLSRRMRSLNDPILLSDQNT